MAKKEKCGETFDDAVCKRPKGHFGKHEAGEESGWVQWTDAGKARILAERARRAEIEREPF
jgi:hypothetical protein